MRLLRSIGVLGAVMVILSNPRPATAAVPWGFVACQAWCGVVAGTCAATNPEFATKCMIAGQGCLAGCLL